MKKITIRTWQPPLEPMVVAPTRIPKIIGCSGTNSDMVIAPSQIPDMHYNKGTNSDMVIAPSRIPEITNCSGTNSDIVIKSRHQPIRPPYNYFGGKRKVAAEVWARFGKVKGYVEPFFGSGAVLLASPLGPLQYEIINDINHFVANFWRSVQVDPDSVAHYCDWPVNEADQHARHTWLVNHCNNDEWRNRMYNDPEFYNAKVAGWWCWGSNAWIGSDWCGKNAGTRIPHIAWSAGVNSDSVIAGTKIPAIARSSGTNSDSVIAGTKIPAITRLRGTNSDSVIAGTRIPAIHRSAGVNSDSVIAGTKIRGTNNATISANLQTYFQILYNRMRKVKVCCGDWARVLSNACTTSTNLYGIFLDPPYTGYEDIYNTDAVSAKVYDWALEHGTDKKFRIALCCQTKQDLPGWSVHSWKRGSGLANTEKADRDRANELVYFSPHCLLTTNSEQVNNTPVPGN